MTIVREPSGRFRVQREKDGPWRYVLEHELPIADRLELIAILAEPSPRGLR